jgi:hypothetical protein
MGIIEILLLGISVAMDAFAVSICKGMTSERKLKTAFVCSTWFSSFQMLMPTIGFCQNNQQTRHTWTCTRITTSDYESYVFSKEFYVDFKIDNEESRYTPSNSDVDKAEKLIRKKIACINQDHDNQELCPLIDENLKKYKRQYIGFTDVYGAKI